MRADAVTKGDGRRWVRAELSVQDAHDLGRYLMEVGHRSNDHVWEDGEALVRASHAAEGACVDPTSCPLPIAVAP